MGAKRALVAIDLSLGRLALAPLDEENWPMAAAAPFTGTLPAALAALVARCDPFTACPMSIVHVTCMLPNRLIS